MRIEWEVDVDGRGRGRGGPREEGVLLYSYREQ